MSESSVNGTDKDLRAIPGDRLDTEAPAGLDIAAILIQRSPDSRHRVSRAPDNPFDRSLIHVPVVQCRQELAAGLLEGHIFVGLNRQ